MRPHRLLEWRAGLHIKFPTEGLLQVSEVLALCAVCEHHLPVGGEERDEDQEGEGLLQLLHLGAIVLDVWQGGREFPHIPARYTSIMTRICLIVLQRLPDSL